MAARLKIDIDKLKALHSKGLTLTAIAKNMGVTKGAVSKQFKKLKLAVVKNVVLESAHKVVRKNLNAIEQLQKINEDANEILDLLMRWNRGDKAALQVLESQVRKVRVGKTEKFVEEFKFKDPRELALRAMQEIRGQLGLQLDIFKTMYDFQATAEFQKEVLAVIGEVDPDVRNLIIERLKEKGALRSAVSIN